MAYVRALSNQLGYVVVVRVRDGEAAGLKDRSRMQVVLQAAFRCNSLAQQLGRELTIAATCCRVCVAGGTSLSRR